MKKNSLFAGLFTLCAWGAFAQNTQQVNLASIPYEDQLDNAFEHLDLSDMTSDILLDYGVHMAPLKAFDGSPTAPASNLLLWKMSYLTLYSAQITNPDNGLQDPDIFLNTLPQNYNPVTTEVPLGLIAFKANTLNENAVTQGQITVSNNQMHSVNGQNPYQEQMVMELAPLVTEVTTNQVQFTMPQEFIVSNLDISLAENAIASMTLDADDGAGFRAVPVSPLPEGNALLIPATASYASSGIKNLEFRFTLANDPDTEYSAKARLKVKVSPQAATQAADQEFTSFTNEHSGGEIFIDYGCGTTGQISKPLIFVEGFDPENSLGPNEIRSRLNQNAQNAPLLQSLQANGYDIIYVNYYDGTDDIRRNAKLLEEVIDWVNSQKVTASISEPNVVIGESMGGLVARYALRSMENRGDDHQTEKFITIDSPHNGANVPIGVQGLLSLAYGFEITYRECPVFCGKKTLRLRDFAPELREGLDLLNTPAAKQMLVNRLLSSPYVEPSMRNELMVDVNYQMPATTENISLANGSQDAVFQPDFGAGDPIIDINLNQGDAANYLADGNFFLSLFYQTLMFSIGASADLQVQANSIHHYGSEQVISKIFARVKLLFLINLVKEDQEIRAGGFRGLDNAPGGKYTLSTYTGEFDFAGIPGGNPIRQEAFSFIPSSSSASIISGNELNINYNIRSSDPQQGQDTEFETIGGPLWSNFDPNTNNEEHIDVTAGGANYLYNYLIGTDGIYTATNVVPANSFNYGEAEDGPTSKKLERTSPFCRGDTLELMMLNQLVTY